MQIQGSKIFITGGAGFIGSRLIEKLVADNQITVFDNFSRNSLVSSPLAGHPNLTLVAGDVCDAASVKRAAAGANIIVHAAAIAGIDSTLRNPVQTMVVNMLGTANVLDAARENGESVHRFLDFSTSEVFGSRAFMVDESASTVTGAVGEARWVYAVSKLAGEHLTHAYHRQYGLPTVTVRPFNIYGPGQVGEGAVSIMVRRALRDEPIFIFGDGSQIRAWCFIDDMVDGLLRSLSDPRAVGQSFNLGNARAVTTIYGLAQTVCRVVNSKSKIIFRPPLSADIELRVPSVGKASELIDFCAKVDLEEGLVRTADWIRENEQHLPALPEIFTRL